MKQAQDPTLVCSNMYRSDRGEKPAKETENSQTGKNKLNIMLEISSCQNH